MDIFALYHRVFNDFIEEHKKADEKRRKALPFQLTPAVLDEKYKKRFNINDNEVHYRITKNGEPIHNGLFRFYITDDTDEINTNRFVIMNTGVEAEYSDSTVKTCKLKYKGRIAYYRCVFDMEKCEIAYLCDEEYNSSLSLYKNVCVDNRKNKIVYLPTKEVLVEEEKSISIIEVDDYLFVSDGKYSRGTFMKRIDTNDGSVLDVDKI